MVDPSSYFILPANDVINIGILTSSLTCIPINQLLPCFATETGSTDFINRYIRTDHRHLTERALNQLQFIYLTLRQ